MLNPTKNDFELPELILASASPRRAEILTAVGWSFRKEIADIDESMRPAEAAADYVERLAIEKARAVAGRHEGLVLGADTTVVVDRSIIGKPNDLDEAREMLRLLSGRWHEVLTGVALVDGMDACVSGIQSTRVKFREMTSAQIDFLVEFGSPLDKAGAYAVQAQAALFIEGIEGDYWNVVGLPVSLVYRLVSEIREADRSSLTTAR